MPLIDSAVINKKCSNCHVSTANRQKHKKHHKCNKSNKSHKHSKGAGLAQILSVPFFGLLPVFSRKPQCDRRMERGLAFSCNKEIITHSNSQTRALHMLKAVSQIIWHKATLPPHMDSSILFARWRQYAPTYMHLLGPPSPCSKRHLNQFRCFCTGHGRKSLCAESPYILQ